MREKTLARIGTAERVVPEQGHSVMHYRKPLTVEEINQMAPTVEVKARAGRP